MLPQKMAMTLKKLLHLNVVTLMKCITLKYLKKINHFPYSIQTHVLLVKILMTFNISWAALKFFLDIIAVTETRITKSISLLNNLNLNILLNSLQLRLVQVLHFFILLIICHTNVNGKMNWNLLLLKLPTQKSQILLWESFTDIQPWTLLTLIVIN